MAPRPGKQIISAEFISDSDVSDDEVASRSQSPNKRRRVAPEEPKKPKAKSIMEEKVVEKERIPKPAKNVVGEPVKKKKKKKIAAKPVEVVELDKEDESSSSSSTSSSSGSLEDEPTTRPATKPAIEVAPVEGDEDASGSDLEPMSSFKPPKGFALSSRAPPSTPFTASKLSNKQIFLFSAPSSLNLLKEAPKFKLQPGPNGDIFTAKYGSKSLFTIRRTDEDESVGISLLLPRDGEAGYKTTEVKPSARFFITESAPLDKFTSIPKRGYVKAKRAQPEGLKMRFKPAGWGDDEDLIPDLDVTMSETPVESQETSQDRVVDETKEEKRARREQKRLEKDARHRKKAAKAAKASS